MWIIRGFLLIPLALALAWLALSPTAQAVCREGCDSSHFNTFLGDDALLNNTTGFSNTAIGYQSLQSNTTGNYNTANGVLALGSNTTGSYNTANGVSALYHNTIGTDNTANGVDALGLNTSGSQNTANGIEALALNTTGSSNTANGALALWTNTTGLQNTATGAYALYSNTTDGNNTATGYGALQNNTIGFSNTANGASALQNNTTGNNNTADGVQALYYNTTGSSNIALGFQAGFNRTTGSNNIDIGNAGAAGKSNIIRIGTNGTQKNAYIAGISGVTVAGGVGVIIDSNGHLGTVVSSERFKDGIRPMDKASEAILALKPVTFRYKHELDPEGIPQFGLVAEQVEKVNPDLVARDNQGKPYTVRYEAVNAMLLNEFLKEHRKVEEQGRKEQELEATIVQQRKDFQASITKLEATVAQQQKDFQTTAAEQQKGMEILTASLKAQASQIQKVTRLRRVEVTKPVPQMVANNQ
jgi:hypothetical protein